jgi:CheY-like chemotaxis protein
MSSVSPRGSPAAEGLLGGLRSWLRDGSARRAASGVAVADAARPNVLPESPVRVLVVDDSALNLALISGLLASRGLVPMLAANGSEAVLLVRELQFDLVLMDLQMPVLDGFQATEAIRQMEGASGRAAVPILAHSSMTLSPRVLAAYGINGSLTKPCDDGDLEACLVRWCPGYRAQPVPLPDAGGVP